MRPTKKIYGKKLAEARKGLYLTQRQFADLAGTTEVNVGRIERYEVSAIELKRVPPFAQALKMTEADFVARICAPDDAKIRRGPLGAAMLANGKAHVEDEPTPQADPKPSPPAANGGRS